jgi:hypothetical protein
MTVPCAGITYVSSVGEDARAEVPSNQIDCGLVVEHSRFWNLRASRAMISWRQLHFRIFDLWVKYIR